MCNAFDCVDGLRSFIASLAYLLVFMVLRHLILVIPFEWLHFVYSIVGIYPASALVFLFLNDLMILLVILGFE